MSLFFLCALLYNTFFRYRHFKIVAATKWLKNESAQTKVIAYRLEILAKKSSEELEFHSFWINNKAFRLRVHKKDLGLLPFFNKKDVVYLDTCEELKGGISPSDYPPRNAGMTEAWLSYRIGKKKKHLAIKSFSADQPDFHLNF